MECGTCVVFDAVREKFNLAINVALLRVKFYVI
jgi:hypothetical protein